MIAWLRSRLVRWLLPEIEQQAGRPRIWHAVYDPRTSPPAHWEQARRTRLPNVRDF
jgi:hypothetical protein